MKKIILLFSVVLTCQNHVSAQSMDINGSVYQSIANYHKPRGNHETPMGKNETYFNTGVYLKAYEGSFIEMIAFDNKRFSIGEYIKVGAGLGVQYSPEFKHLSDDGSYSVGFGGVYGTQEIKVAGPVTVSNFGYLVELNYGLQMRYKFDPESYPERAIGVRWYYGMMVNPIFHVRDLVIPNGYFMAGMKSVYATHEQYSACIDWCRRKEDGNQSHDLVLSATLRKHKENKTGYWGMKLDYIHNAHESVSQENSIAFAVNGLNAQLIIGRAIF